MLERAVSERLRRSPRTTLLDRGEALRQSTMRVEGFTSATSTIRTATGRSSAFHVPGDFVDLHGLLLHALDHSIGTLTHAVIALVPQPVLKARPHRSTVAGAFGVAGNCHPPCSRTPLDDPQFLPFCQCALAQARLQSRCSAALGQGHANAWMLDDLVRGRGISSPDSGRATMSLERTVGCWKQR